MNFPQIAALALHFLVQKVSCPCRPIAIFARHFLFEFLWSGTVQQTPRKSHDYSTSIFSWYTKHHKVAG
jgi:hypothetical protein